jgi:pimeloyl-ACP methyl ester carboxylesterase
MLSILFTIGSVGRAEMIIGPVPAQLKGAEKAGFHLLQPFLHTDFVIRTLARTMKIPQADYNDFKQGMLAMSPSSFTRSFLQALSLRQASGLEHVTCPVLFVAGEAEPQAVKQSNVMLAHTLPHAKCVVAPHMGHAWLAEAPELHIKMVRAWLCDQPLALSPAA